MLATVWFLLWGLLWAVYFMLGGFDLGLGVVQPFVARSEEDRRLIGQAMGPYWNGNEVWLIAAGGVTFAAFPTTYAVMFSGLYAALMLILFGLILRGVALEFRHLGSGSGWKSLWDACLFVGSLLPAFLLGVAFANIFQGIPIDENGVFQGSLLTLLNPYGLLGGLLFLLLFVEHGTLWLALKTTGTLHDQAARLAKGLWWVLAATAVGFLVATWFATRLYANYLENPMLFSVPIVLIPALTVGALFAMRFFAARNHWGRAWVASALTIVGATFFGVVGLYPNMLPSSLNPTYSLTVHNASSSPLTLKIMLVVAVIFVPIVLAYQGWAYRLFHRKVSLDEAAYAYEEA
ncbi:cytochrome d ubiquinol oxidase subunit II [Desulfosoma caldarium]|uniref:Cytochrome bd-I ubiquinol oxidase subunit 2 apoprotein n=1 Tax=Desulfosoma caldarium TaxID=610254 RepID=A0A3N1ULH3_9BACT|nr:cytochrome d ubiquinol oxidase subunit II [Desulfosoma caldarium]ROQ90249.1 cytochrome bd-I ubiquinol oxidase subunit 2 apoprotein [Desulfosoma caldarium]